MRTTRALAFLLGRVVGFCNPHCRDGSAAHADDRPGDTESIDALLAELGARG